MGLGNYSTKNLDEKLGSAYVSEDSKEKEERFLNSFSKIIVYGNLFIIECAETYRNLLHQNRRKKKCFSKSVELFLYTFQMILSKIINEKKSEQILLGEKL